LVVAVVDVVVEVEGVGSTTGAEVTVVDMIMAMAVVAAGIAGKWSRRTLGCTTTMFFQVSLMAAHHARMLVLECPSALAPFIPLASLVFLLQDEHVYRFCRPIDQPRMTHTDFLPLSYRLHVM
jgi:hypothetical protein